MDNNTYAQQFINENKLAAQSNVSLPKEKNKNTLFLIIIAVLAVLSIVTLALFAVRSIMAGRSTYYTIAACGAMSMFVFQTMLNVFGCLDLMPFTGVTFPFVSNGGTSMIVSWALLAFVKSADTREKASLAVKGGAKR